MYVRTYVCMYVCMYVCTYLSIYDTDGHMWSSDNDELHIGVCDDLSQPITTGILYSTKLW